MICLQIFALINRMVCCQICLVGMLIYDDDRTYPLVKEERVAHIHLAAHHSPFPHFLRQYKRTSDQAHLVYCQGAMDTSAYLLIIILKPEAHKMARNNNHMHKIGVMAEAFRMKY